MPRALCVFVFAAAVFTTASSDAAGPMPGAAPGAAPGAVPGAPDDAGGAPFSLTIYGDGWGQVWDRREVTLAAGINRLAFAGVSRRIMPSSVILGPADGIALHEVLYDFALLTPESLLRRAVGGPVGVARLHPGSGERLIEDGTLLSIEGGILVKIGERVFSVSPDQIVFREVPTELRAQPTLLAQVESTAAGRRTLPLGYLTQGLGWSADYVALWHEAAGKLELSGRATLTNTTGSDFPDAEVSLIAGAVNRETPAPADRMMKGGRAQPAPMMAEAAAMPERQAFANLHLYRLPQRVRLADRETRQVALLRLPDVAVRQEYRSESTTAAFRQPGEPEPTHPQVRLLFDNPSAGGGGAPLPAGIVRVYAGSSDALPRLVGEDRIGHVPAGAPVMLTPGAAFDLTVLRRQTDFVRKGPADSGASESAWRIEVRNARERDADVTLVEVIPGDWSVLAESAAHEKEAADRLAWRLRVPGGGTAQLTYRVLIRP